MIFKFIYCSRRILELILCFDITSLNSMKSVENYYPASWSFHKLDGTMLLFPPKCGIQHNAISTNEMEVPHLQKHVSI